MNISSKLAALLGPMSWLPEPDQTAPFSRDWLDRFGVPPIGVARPSTTDEVAAVLRICHDQGIPVVPQGGKTGLVGGSVSEDPDAVLLSLSRMNRIEDIDGSNFTVTVEAGVVLQNLHLSLADHDLHFPMHLGSEGSAQIGGLIATNAGGSHAFRFGMMQDLVVGLDVVLPDGRVWQGSRAVTKDNGGFQLRKLFCGSEGRIGVITRAVLRLYPAARKTATALIAVPDINALIETGRVLRRDLGDFLTALEFFDDPILKLALQHIPDLRCPLEGAANYYLLAEVATSHASLDPEDLLTNSLESVFEAGSATDAVIAQNQAQRVEIWRLREELPEGTLREGRQLKHDISVPVSRIEESIATSTPKILELLPDARIWTFGHLGDGNLHFNVSPPADENHFGGRDKAINLAVYETAERLGGSFAAEHGTGRSKSPLAIQLRSEVERSLMAAISNAFDPEKSMNPSIIV